MRKTGAPMKPAEILASPLSGWKLEFTTNAPPYGVTRVFSRADGSWARLEETDRASGQSLTGMPTNS